MRYLINKTNLKELLRCLSIANICHYVKYLGVSPSLGYNTLEYRLMYSRLRIAGAELSLISTRNNQSHVDYGFQERVVLRRYCLSSSGAGFAARRIVQNWIQKIQ